MSRIRHAICDKYKNIFSYSRFSCLNEIKVIPVDTGLDLCTETSTPNT